MNFRDQDTIRAPSGKDDICAVFIIDTPDEPFVLQDITGVGQEYTLSFYAKAESAGGISVADKSMPIGTDWKRYVITFTADDTDLPIYFTTAGTYYLYNTQLEIGNKDTDWSLNPADTEQSLDDLAVVVNNHSTQFSIMDGQISALIAEDATIRGDYDALVSRTTAIEANLDGITSRVALTEADLNGVDRRLTEAESTIVQQANEIALTVKEQDVTGNYIVGKLNLSSTTAKIAAKNIDLSGYVTVSSLKTAGATTIDGSNITTGLISADRIDAESLMTKKLTATNLTVTGNSKFSGVLDGATGTFAGSLSAASGTFAGTLSGATGSFSGAVTATSLKAKDALYLYDQFGNEIEALSSIATTAMSEKELTIGGSSVNSINIYNRVRFSKEFFLYAGTKVVEINEDGLDATGSNSTISVNSANRAIDIRTSEGEVQYNAANSLRSGRFVVSNSGKIGLYDAWNTEWIIVSDAERQVIVHDRVVVPISGAAGIRGNGDNTYACGHSSYRWTAVYAKNGTIQTSDEREKHFLNDLDVIDLHEVFMALQPKAFTWLTGDDRKIHLGVGAQSAERCLEHYGYDSERFSMVQRDILETPSDLGLTDRYSMDYQFINMLTLAETQRNSRDIEDMQDKIDYLLDENAKLKKQLKELKKTA